MKNFIERFQPVITLLARLVLGGVLLAAGGLKVLKPTESANAVAAYKVLIENIDKLAPFETVPVGSGVAPSVRELVEMIHACSHSKSTIEFGAVAMRVNELMFSCADTSRLRLLGWKSAFNLESGIQATLKGKEL